MIRIIVGEKGSGKTKRFIQMVNDAVKSSNGSVACIEKERTLIEKINHKARLVCADDFNICGFDKLFGLISGIVANDYDTKEIYVDRTFKICGKDKDKLYNFLVEINNLSCKFNIDFLFTLSCRREDINPNVEKICKII